jgi:hypothetical protein
MLSLSRILTTAFILVSGTFVAKKILKKLQKIQERALRFIYEDYENTYANLLKKSKLPSLKIRRLRTIAVETFKIISDICLSKFRWESTLCLKV